MDDEEIVALQGQENVFRTVFMRGAELAYIS